MLTESQIKQIVGKYIEKVENIGEGTGGSGNLGFTSFEIKSISSPKPVQSNDRNSYEITFEYSISIETEFTYYPDNPPMEYSKNGRIQIDCDGNLLS